MRITRESIVKTGNITAMSVMIVLEAVFMFMPAGISVYAALIMGISLMTDGTIKAITCVIEKRSRVFKDISFPAAVLSAAAGQIMAIEPSFFGNYINIIAGITVIALGAVNLSKLGKLRECGCSKWGTPFIPSVITIILGAAGVFVSFIDNETMLKLTGFVIIFAEVYAIWIMRRLKLGHRKSKSFRTIIEGAFTASEQKGTNHEN